MTGAWDFAPNTPLLRRGFLAGSAGLLAAAPAIAQTPLAAQPAATEDNGPTITVERAMTNPIPIAITGLSGTGGGVDIGGVINADLARCGLFHPLDSAIFSTGDSPAAPNFQNWKGTGAHALVTGQITGTDPLRVEFRLWDVLTGQQIQGTAYTTAAANWRRIAHIIADVVYERLIGEKGYFDTRIVYVSATGPRGRQVKRLAIMDQDSANNRVLTDGSWMVLTPRFNPTRDQIAFMSYANDRPRVYLFDLNSGHQSTLGEFEGMSFAPRFSPDGSSCIISVTRGGGSDIFVVDVASRASRRLTSSGSIDTSPCYSPDASQIVFNSDRDGSQQLYVMGAGGGGAKRISFGAGRYSTPAWSPKGDLIAFTRQKDGLFAIGVMKPDGSGERIITEGFHNEGPTFAPNGLFVMFFRDPGGQSGAKIFMADIFGRHPEFAVPTPSYASDPAWGPLLN
jgi:TolB protein